MWSHTETHHPHASHHHESSDRLFLWPFYEAVVQHDTCVTDFCRVRRVVSWGTTPGNFQFSGTCVVAQSCAAICQKHGAIIAIFYDGLVSIALSLFTACPRFVTLTALQTAAAVVCAHDYRAVRTLQTSPTLVVCSREQVGCGNGGTLCRS